MWRGDGTFRGMPGILLTAVGRWRCRVPLPHGISRLHRGVTSCICRGATGAAVTEAVKKKGSVEGSGKGLKTGGTSAQMKMLERQWLGCPVGGRRFTTALRLRDVHTHGLGSYRRLLADRCRVTSNRLLVVTGQNLATSRRTPVTEATLSRLLHPNTTSKEEERSFSPTGRSRS